MCLLGSWFEKFSLRLSCVLQGDWQCWIWIVLGDTSHIWRPNSMNIKLNLPFKLELENQYQNQALIEIHDGRRHNHTPKDAWKHSWQMTDQSQHLKHWMDMVVLVSSNCYYQNQAHNHVPCSSLCSGLLWSQVCIYWVQAFNIGPEFRNTW